MLPYLIRLVILAPILIQVSRSDLRSHTIPNSKCLMLFLAGIALPLLPLWNLSWREVIITSLATAIIGYLFFLFGLGAGDAKLCTAIASLVGYDILPIVILACIFMGMVALGLLITKKIDRDSRLPMAPAISAATLIYALLPFIFYMIM